MSLVQWAAASAAGRGVRYYPFANANAKGLPQIVAHVKDVLKWNAGDLISFVVGYVGGPHTLFDSILSCK